MVAQIYLGIVQYRHKQTKFSEQLVCDQIFLKKFDNPKNLGDLVSFSLSNKRTFVFGNYFIVPGNVHSLIWRPFDRRNWEKTVFDLLAPKSSLGATSNKLETDFLALKQKSSSKKSDFKKRNRMNEWMHACIHC